MTYYGGTADRLDRAKASAGVVAVHAALAFLILSGLNVRIVEHAVERLTTIDVTEPPPPPPAQPPSKPAPRPHVVKKAEGAPAKKSEPSPIVAPQPKLPVPSPVPAAKVAGTGAASTSGAAAAGNGTGAGGLGNGPGGGADYSRFTPARQISGIPNREYRKLSASGIINGSVGITIRVNPDGSVSNCRVARSSGSGFADTAMCQLTEYYVRFRPALDGAGRPVAEDVTWYPRWWRP